MKLVYFLLSITPFTSCSSTDISGSASNSVLADTLVHTTIDTLVSGEINVAIDISKTTHRVSKNPAGVVSCWLLYSDLERPRKISFVEAMKDIGVKYIRFPYGHLADNYLWDADGDWGNTLTPKDATLSQIPGSWDWAVNQSNGLFIKDTDFDEYISIYTEIGAEPLVVINILSYKYQDGSTFQQLKETAVEWVRYANLTNDYKVSRWALGNEVDHHSDLISLQGYKAL